MALGLKDKKYVKVIKGGVNYNCVTVRVVKDGKTYNVWGSGSSVTYVVDNGVAYSEDVKNGDSVLSPKSFTPSKDGYTFVGWRTDKTASATVLTSKTMGTEPITLYAVFKRTLTLSYNGNGSTSGSTSSQTGTQYYNNGNTANPSFTLKSSGFSKTDYSFSKWAMGNANGTQYSAGASVSISENTTFYAVWKAINKTVSALVTKFNSGDIHISQDGYQNRVLLYGPIDASVYKGIQLTVTGCDGNQSFSQSAHHIGVGSSPTNSTKYSTSLTASKTLVSCYGDEGHASLQETTTVTLNFAETSGNVYVYGGVVSGDGYGSWNIYLNSSMTLLAR